MKVDPARRSRAGRSSGRLYRAPFGSPTRRFLEQQSRSDEQRDEEPVQGHDFQRPALGDPNPAISAIVATNAWASAIANNARAILCG
jgi:hypothetical protein